MPPSAWILRLAGLNEASAHAKAEKLEGDDENAPLAVSLNETDEARRIWEVVAYFSDRQGAEAAANHLSPGQIDISELPDVDWVRKSLQGLGPVSAGRFHLHGAHDRARRRVGGVSLEIDAGTAFGTGHHATTIGCLEALDRLLKRSRPCRILDIGCGTGVLALAAAKALHCSVIATDIDPEAVSMTRLNARRNAAAPLIRAAKAAGTDHPLIHVDEPYDLIFANILARPLVALAPSLTRLLAPGGRVVLSGLTRDQQRHVSAAYRRIGLLFERRVVIGNWVTLQFRR